MWKVPMSRILKKVYVVLVYIWKFLNSSIIVACFSTLVFGVILAKYGAKYNHEFWLQQTNISRHLNKLSKMEDEQVALIIRIHPMMGKYEQELWNLFSAVYGFRSAKKSEDAESEKKDIERIQLSRDALQLLKSDMDDIAVKNRIFFPQTISDILNGELGKYHEKAHSIILEETNWEKEGLTVEEFNNRMNELHAIGDSIRNRLGKAIIPAKE